MDPMTSRRLMEQVEAGKKANTALIERIVELEHAHDAARRWATLWRRGAGWKRRERIYWKGEAMRRSRLTDLYIEGMAARNTALIDGAAALEAALRALVGAVDNAMTTNAAAVERAVRAARALLEEAGHE